ncbi:metal ABC transporter permease [Edaphobacter paludis]|uniref:High-affinity zinc uptake system membrane protein ZnuB n=1 Tax=Edaphobacter paludis TaxID=3035702 RepID=A0AAU7D9R1_9BACT
MNHPHNIYAVLLTLLFATAAGLLGCFALMRRMLLAGDVISHLALPGLGLAFMFHLHPLAGGACSLLLGTLLIAQLQKRTGLATDATIAVVFASSLAIGAALTPQEDLVDAFFGKFQPLSFFSFTGGLLAVLLILFFIFRFKDELVLTLFSPELAVAMGVKANRLNLYFLLVFSLVVLIGLRFMGALLAGALIMLPAATGRQLSNNLSGFLWTSSIAGMVAVALGLISSDYMFRGLSLGPATTMAAAALFAVSLLRKSA